MELKQSSAVPFAVTDPISGLDITKDVQLVSIESVGEGDFPYFQPNGDYTFTVVNAARDEIVTPTTFTLDVPYAGEVHRLTATTDMTIQATDKSFMKVNILKPLGSVIVAPVNTIFSLELQSSYRGIDLTADDLVIQKHKPGTDPDPSYPIKFVSVTTKADGKTLDVKWQGADTMIGPFTFYVLRKETTELVEGEDWVQVDMNLRIGIAGMRIGPLHDSSSKIYGHQNELINGWYSVYLNGVPIKLNDPKLTLTLVGGSGIGGIANVIVIDGRFEDHIVFRIKGKPGNSSSDPIAGSATGAFTINATYEGNNAVTGCTLNWVPSNNMISDAEMQQPLFPNQTQKLVTQFGAVKGFNIPPWYQIEGAKVRAGSIFVTQYTGGAEVQQVVVEPGTPLNSINQLVRGISASWMKQRVSLSGFVLDLPFITDSTLYQTMWGVSASTIIAEAVTTPVLNNNKVNSKAGSTTYVIVEMRQMRDGVSTLIPGLWTNVKAVGAGTLASTASTSDGKYIIGINGGGTLGDVRVTGKFTPTDTNSEAKDYDIDLVAISETEFGVVTTPKTVPCEVWDILKDPPFDVLINGVPSTSKIRNIRYQPTTWFIETTKDDPNQWQIVHNVTSVNLTNVTFTFEAQVNGVWGTYVGKGVYEIAGYDGVALRVTADYGKGVGVTTEIPVVRASKNRITVWPVYKNQPLKSGFKGSVSVGSWITNASISIVGPAEDGVGVVIEYTAPDTSGAASNSSTLTLTIDGTPGTTINVNKWVGNFTGIYMLEGLYVLPVTLQPSTQQFGKPYTWDSKIYYAGKLLDPADPRLSMEVSNAGALPPYISLVGMKDKTVYFALNTNPGTNGTIANRLMVTYDDGIAPPETSGYLDLRAGYNGSLGLPVTLKPLATPVPNKENIIPVEFWRNEASIGKPTIVHTVSGYSSPNDTNTLIGDLELIDDPNDSTRNALKFGSGWTGGKVVLDMVAEFPGLSDPWYVRNNEMTVDGAVVTTASEDLVINGITDSAKVITFTLSQERLIDGSIQTYTFADATISNGVTVSGAIQRVDTISNTAGVFKATFYGKGMEGKGIATFTVTDPDGHTYKVDVITDAEIDSSGVVLVLSPAAASGKKGDRLKFTGSLTVDGVSQRFDASNLTWTAEPAGYLTMTMREVNNVYYDVERSTPEEINTKVTLVVNIAGRTGKHEVDLKVLPDTIATPKAFSVKVWNSLAGTPFTVKQGTTDITSTILDVGHDPSEWILDTDTPNRYIIQADGPKPAQDVVVKWFYRLPTDPVGTKHYVDVTYKVAEYDGNILTYVLSGDGVLPVGKKTNLGIDVYIKGVRTTSNISYVGVGPGPLYLTYNSGTPVAPGQFVVVYTTNTIRCIEEPMKWKFKVDGGYEGNPTGEFMLDYVITIWDSAYPLFVSPFKPGEITGKFGDSFELKCKATWQGTIVSMKNVVPMLVDPAGVIVYDTAATTSESLTVKFVKDIDTNKVVSNVDTTFGYSVYPARSVNRLVVNQIAVNLKLTAAEGFQTTGSGDMENPVTLTQSVLNPE